ncbi:MAG: hypothetical protein FJX54_15370 [Alphaproteobacteria bacterium]|nr:hypothetical protein [Alphaproteobacteria bacterium]
MGLLAAWFSWVMISSALAQAPVPLRPQPPPPVPPPSVGECALLPGGNAPVNKIAELAQPLSPRSLDLTYFNKRLADLTDEDFDRIVDIATKCNRTTTQAAREKTRRLRDVVRESQSVRMQTLDKVEETKTAVAKVRTPREKVEALNNAWANLHLLQDTITKTDLREYAAWISRSMQQIYDSAPGYGKRPTVAEVLASVPPKQEQVVAISRTRPDTGGPLPVRPWWSQQRDQEDER